MAYNGGPWTNSQGWTAVGQLTVSDDRALAIQCVSCDWLIPYEQTGRHATYEHTCGNPRIQFRMYPMELENL